MRGVSRVYVKCLCMVVILLLLLRSLDGREADDTHVMAARKEEEAAKFRRAFGIADDHVEGATTDHRVGEHRGVLFLCCRSERESKRSATESKCCLPRGGG